MSLRLASPAALVDINRLHELNRIEPCDGGLAIGAMVRQRTAERDAFVRERVPLLAAALPHVGHVQIRNRGTVCGSLAHADPASELPAVAAALDAELVVRSATGERVISASDFFVGYLTTALRPDELLEEVRFPAWPAGAGWSFQEISRRHGDYALVGIATMLQLGASGTVADVRLAITGVGPGPVRCRQAEKLLRNELFSINAIAAAAESVGREIDPLSDVHASAAYRRHVAGVLTRRSLAEAASRAEGRT